LSVPNRLTALQRDILESFFAATQDFYLTGGAALAWPVSTSAIERPTISISSRSRLRWMAA
jgi:hypothetical protein